jgi:hypothetical protein
VKEHEDTSPKNRIYFPMGERALLENRRPWHFSDVKFCFRACHPNTLVILFGRSLCCFGCPFTSHDDGPPIALIGVGAKIFHVLQILVYLTHQCKLNSQMHSHLNLASIP